MRAIGNIGEDYAVKILKKNKYKVVERNFTIRGGEIDIIAKDGESICSAEFPITPDDKYVRITITDADGKYAYTNAYFTDELFD